MPKVFIVNKSSHDFSEAKKFGDIVFLSEGPLDRYATNNMHRQFTEILKKSKPNDYLIPCSLNVMNVIAAAIFAAKHKRLNLLLFRKKNYVERNIVL